MAYDPTVNWEDGVTALSAEHMNNLEEGVREALSKSEGNNDMWSYIRNLVYPVGSIYMSATLETHEAVEAILGGTWEAWGAGRVPVGVGTSDKTFAKNEQGGSSTPTLPSHTHTGPSHTHSLSHTHSVSGSTGSAGSHSHGAGGLTGTTPKLTADNDDYLHVSHAASTSQGTITNSSSASYSYLRQSVSGLSSRSTGRDAPSISAGKTVSISGSVSTDGAHSHSISLTSGGASTTTTSASGTGATGSAGSDATNKNLQPYITCFMYKRIA